MREEFIAKIKDFIRQQPDNDEGLANIRKYVQQFGATEEEFSEALRQVVFESLERKGSEETKEREEREGIKLQDSSYKFQAYEPHELAIRPEHEIQVYNDGELDKRTKQDRQFKRLKRYPTTADELREIKDEILASEQTQLSAFQKELYDTKTSLIQAFDAELEKQKSSWIANQKALSEQDVLEKKMTKKFSHPAFQTALALIVIAVSLSTLFLVYASRIPAKIASQAAQLPKLITRDEGVQKVFAHEEPLDPNQVFSYPPTQVNLVATGIPKKEIVGFLPYWMMPVANKISFTNLTTLILFGLEMDGGGNIVTTDKTGQPDQGWQMYNDPSLIQILTRAHGQGLDTAYTLKMFDNKHIEDLVRSDTAQKQFIANALYILNSKNLNGINLDFEYVGTPPQDVQDGFTRLVQNLHTAMKQQFPTASLTIDTYATAGAEGGLFDVRQLSLNAEALIIMGYDFHTPLGEPGPIAPMETEIGLVGLMQSYLDKVTPDKLILAVPYYGYDWKIPRTDAATIVSYAQAVDQSKNLPLTWNDSSQTPSYEYNDQTGDHHQVYFENTRSLGIKYDFVNQKDLKGVGIWALGYDGQNTDLQSLLIEKFGQTPNASNAAFISK